MESPCLVSFLPTRWVARWPCSPSQRPVAAPSPDILITNTPPGKQPNTGGQVPQPDIVATPAQLDLGAVGPGCTKDGLITLSNEGDADLEVTAVKLKGTDGAWYTLAGGPVTLSPGGTADVRVDFGPDDYRMFADARVVVDSNDPDTPKLKVPVSGQGAEWDVSEAVLFQEGGDKVDVLWLLDSSCSMSDDIDNLDVYFEHFLQSFSSLQLDYHVAVANTGDGDTCANFAGPVELTNGDQVQIIDESTSDPVEAFSLLNDEVEARCYGEAGFDGAKDALSPARLAGANSGFLRSDAALAIVALSDEVDQSSQSSSQFVSWLQSMKPTPDKVSFSALVGPASRRCPAGSTNPDASDVDPAPAYHDAIRRTNGVWGDLCQFDFQPFLQHLGFVAAGFEYRVELAHEPLTGAPPPSQHAGDPSRGIVVMDDAGNEIPFGRPNGWIYKQDCNCIELYDTAIPGRGETVTVMYPHATTCGL